MAAPLEYYEWLGVEPTAGRSEIFDAYRAKSTASHPDTSKGDAAASETFRRAAEAFVVLKDATKRAEYDREGAVEPVPRNPLDVFVETFGEAEGGVGGLLVEAGEAAAPGVAAEETVIELGLTLEQLFGGCTVRADAGEGRWKDIEVRPGWKAGTRITFLGEGAGGGDLTFVLAELPHKRFRRSGRSLIYTASIALADALAGSVVDVPTLDGRVLPVGVYNIVRPGYTQTVPGEGFPSAKTGKRGNLVIEFRVRYPAQLTEHQRQELRRVLPSA